MCIRVRSERIWNQWVFSCIAREFCITSKLTSFTIDFNRLLEDFIIDLYHMGWPSIIKSCNSKVHTGPPGLTICHTATYYVKMFLQISLQKKAVLHGRDICEIKFLVEQAYFRTVVALWCCWTKSFLRNESKRAEISFCRCWDVAFDSGRSRPSVSFSDIATSASTE